MRVASGRVISQRQFRWFYWMRNVAMPVLVVLVGYLAVGAATSEYAPTLVKVFISVLAVTSITVGLTVGLLFFLPLRLQADRASQAVRAAIIFNSGAERDPRGGSPSVELGSGWVNVVGGGLAVSRAEAADPQVRVIPWSEIDAIERSFPAGTASYPGIAISTRNKRIDLEVPRQSGLTFAGITTHELGRILTDLRAANPARHGGRT